MLYSDPRNKGLTWRGRPVDIDTEIREGCVVWKPKLSIWTDSCHRYAYIKRTTSGRGKCLRVEPIMQSYPAPPRT